MDWEYSLSVSLMEIYNETLKDLLNVSSATPLDIKQGKDCVYVPGLQEIEVKNVDDVNSVSSISFSLTLKPKVLLCSSTLHFAYDCSSEGCIAIRGQPFSLNKEKNRGPV